jgi:hypothetical protein
MTHPALALLRCGSIPDALACLRERDDHPAALALLEAGFTDYAEVVLAECSPRPRGDALEGVAEAARRHAPAGGVTGLETREIGKSGRAGRTA